MLRGADDAARSLSPTTASELPDLPEAPLNPPPSSDSPTPASAEPAYWVSPRHLAGDDGRLAEQIGTHLTSAGWKNWPTARDTLLYLSPDQLRGAEWILASYPFELGGLPVAWQISARAHPASAMTAWNAYFTTGTPHEAIADFLFALDARSEPDTGFDEPETVLAALTAQGWIRDIDRPATTAMDPAFTSSVSLEPLPDLVHDADPRPDLAGWQAWAEPVLGRRIYGPPELVGWAGRAPDRRRAGERGSVAEVLEAVFEGGVPPVDRAGVAVVPGRVEPGFERLVAGAAAQPHRRVAALKIPSSRRWTPVRWLGIAEVVPSRESGHFPSGSSAAPAT
ncbi:MULTISPECIES: DUF317 domain-containing protein [Streptomyces]|uniref:DUF317 domain-containing protein n=1 Tax=Streptomyces TaxID=1883 RepID=UPI0028BEF730|nr:MULTISPECIES: DUF317 domain-containing protein [Streptomyces]